MADREWDNEIYFNGIDGETGGYLTPAASIQKMVNTIKSHQFVAQHYEDLERKKESEKPGLPIPEYLGDSSDLKISGWGMIFPATADPQRVDDILEAMDELIQLRKSQTGENICIIFRGVQGFQWESGKPETKNSFLARQGVTAGNFEVTKVPFYLLIVADPLSIPFTFQHEMDVDYACGRIYFPTIEEYARYAHSVWMAEKRKVVLPRRASFFGVHNILDPTTEGDRATGLSNKHLIDPLVKIVEEISLQKKLDWEAQQINPTEADRITLQSLLGGSKTPALLFSASHGMGWSKPNEMQIDLQGALVCGDWKGPGSGAVQRNHYLAAADLPEANTPLGMIAFFFACYSAGTPYRDAFAVAMNQQQTQIAHRPFLAALPMKLLSHPNGGALAVVGHVERAWAYSFMHDNIRDQTQPFEAMIRMLLEQKTLGHALDWMNLRYAFLAVSLQKLLAQEWVSPGTVDAKELAYLWTATNDAGGYAILGDPAVRLAVTKKSQKISQPVFTLIGSFDGTLPVVFDLPALSTLSAVDQQWVVEENQKLGLETIITSSDLGVTTETKKSERNDTVSGSQSIDSVQVNGSQRQSHTQPFSQPFLSPIDSLAFALSAYESDQPPSFAISPEGISFNMMDEAKEKIKVVVENLNAALQKLSVELKKAVDESITLTVTTGVVGSLDDLSNPDKRFVTSIQLDGDINLFVPRDVKDVDNVLLALHKEMVAQALNNRLEMVKAIGEVIASLFGGLK